MDSEQFPHELMRQSITPGSLSSDLVEQAPIFLGGQDEEFAQ